MYIYIYIYIYVYMYIYMYIYIYIYRERERERERAQSHLREGNRGNKTIEQIYQKKSQLEHILLRPDTYVGSTEHQFQETSGLLPLYIIL